MRDRIKSSHKLNKHIFIKKHQNPDIHRVFFITFDLPNHILQELPVQRVRALPGSSSSVTSVARGKWFGDRCCRVLKNALPWKQTQNNPKTLRLPQN